MATYSIITVHNGNIIISAKFENISTARTFAGDWLDVPGVTDVMVSKDVRVAELNANQHAVYKAVIDQCNNYFGGWCNTLDDSERGSDNWNDAVDALTAKPVDIAETILHDVRRFSPEWQYLENTHFVGLGWLKERVYRRVAKEMKNIRAEHPELF